VVVYVKAHPVPSGVGGSADTFAAHVAVMAPGTAIRAATPVDLEGGDFGEKGVNDFALAESVARLRDRNVEFAVDTVRRARSAPADEVLELDAIDWLARSLPELLEAINGTEVVLAGGGSSRWPPLGPRRRSTTSASSAGSSSARRLEPGVPLLSVGTLGLITRWC
jgi:membrane-bound serine protease (ClpP class)